MNLFFKIIFFASFLVILNARANESNFSCSGQIECKEAAHQFGNAFFALGAMVIPHFLVDSNGSIEVDSGRIGLGSGSNSMSRLEVEMSSFFNNSQSVYLKTFSDLSFYNREFPAELSYGIGGGKSFLFSTAWLFKSELLGIAYKTELDNNPEVASQINISGSYFVSNNLGFELSLANTFLAPEIRHIGFKLLGKTKKSNEFLSDLSYFLGIGVVDKKYSDGSTLRIANHSTNYFLIGFRF